jgi:hypothetical protein
VLLVDDVLEMPGLRLCVLLDASRQLKCTDHVLLLFAKGGAGDVGNGITLGPCDRALQAVARRSAGLPQRRSPEFAEHTEAVILELGEDRDRIAAPKESGAIGSDDPDQ